MDLTTALVGAGIFVAMTLIAYRLPTTTIVLLLLLAVIPTVFQMTPDYVEDYAATSFGFKVYDIVLISMVGASIINVRRTRSNNPGTGLLKYVVFFAMWLVFEIIRNLSTYGISAPGEFRFTYLILIVPIYVGLFFRASSLRLRLLKILIGSSVLIPLLCVPVIGNLKGWSIGPDARFLSSQISLGLVYGLAALVLARRHAVVRMNRLLLWGLAILVFAMVLLDGHRSVWLAVIICIMTLFAFKELDLARVMRSTLPILLAGIVGILLIPRLGSFLVDYVGGRATAFVNYQQDQTASWRVAIWAMSLDKILVSPLIGEGFGGGWYVPLPQFRELVTVSPHSLYVQTLVKIGLIGLLGYGAIVLKVFSALRTWLGLNRPVRDPDVAIVLIAIVCLIASHAYYTVYTYEYYSCLFLGLGLAAIRPKGTVELSAGVSNHG